MGTAAHHHGGDLPDRDVLSALVCRVGSRWLAIPLRDVGETMRALPVSPVAGAPPFVRGLTILRGEGVPVLDAGVLLGGQPCTAERFVSLRAGGRWAALAVDEVKGIRALGGLGELPPLLRESPSSAQQLGILDAQLLLLLQAARLVPESVWSALEPR
jgi:purine-binding chemotaxis protein CheW